MAKTLGSRRVQELKKNADEFKSKVCEIWRFLDMYYDSSTNVWRLIIFSGGNFRRYKVIDDSIRVRRKFSGCYTVLEKYGAIVRLEPYGVHSMAIVDKLLNLKGISQDLRLRGLLPELCVDMWCYGYKYRNGLDSGIELQKEKLVILNEAMAYLEDSSKDEVECDGESYVPETVYEELYEDEDTQPL